MVLRLAIGSQFWFTPIKKSEFKMLNLKYLKITDMKKLIALIGLFSFFAPAFAQYHLDFNGSNSYISFNSRAFDNKTAFTVELWVNPQNISSGYSSLIGEDNCVEFGFHNNKIHAWLEGRNSSNSHTIKSVYAGSNLSSLHNTWHHIALTADASAVKIYLDGEEIHSSSNSIVKFKASGQKKKLKIGGYVFSSSSNLFKGSMDEVRIWNKALSASDIRMAMCQKVTSNSSGTIKGSVTSEVSASGLDWDNNLDRYYSFDYNVYDEVWDETYPYKDGSLNNINGSNRPSETSPLPYESVANGNWGTASTWKANQTKPQNKWAITRINHNVNVNEDAPSRWLIVNSGKNLTVTGNNDLIITDLIDNGGTVLASEHGSIVQMNTGANQNKGAGTYKVKRSGKGSKLAYNIWSSPIQSADIVSTFSGVNACDVYAFDATIQKWKYDFAAGYNATCNGNPVTFSANDVFSGGDGKMDVGRGYFVPGHETNTKKVFTGKINNGDISAPVAAANNPGGVNWSGDNWNMLGNPYPSALNINPNDPKSFTSVNASAISGDVYFWVDDNSGGTGYNQSSDYAVFNGTGGVAANGSGVPNGYVASGQGFWVIATATKNVTFNNAMRANKNNNKFFKSEGHPKIWLDLTNTKNQINQILIGLIDQSSRGYDMGFDAPKAEGNTTIAFASVAKKERYSIQAVPSVQQDDSTGIELYVNAGFVGVHHISLSNTENLGDDHELYILDKENGKVHNLKNGPYSFYVAQAGDFKERFYLQINRKPTVLNTNVVERVVENKILVSRDGDDIMIDGTDALLDFENVSIYDMQGKKLREFENLSMKANWNVAGVASGVYNIVIITKEGRFVKKVVVS